jgi:copper chaperone NosL
MTKISKITGISAVLILLLVYLFPLWRIDLTAPQYPEGIGLSIWVNKITGKNPNDLRNINGLNHYIGMKEINPDSIPELKIMPPLVGCMIVLGLLAAAWGRKKLLLIWTILLFLIMAVGLVDFYMWEYDYGHDLNPKAAIKIPGMSYQPPLLGSKQLLNMRTSSWPHVGGLAIVLSSVLSVLSLTLLNKQKNIEN